MIQSPLSLPDVQDASEPGVLMQVVWLVIAVALVGWAVWYIVRKLPRGEDGTGSDGWGPEDDRKE